MLSGELDPSEAIARLPLTAPAVVGANFTANVKLWFTASVAGNVKPLMEKFWPGNTPLEILRGGPPGFVSGSDLLLELPTCTLPKATLAGFALSVPLPCPVPSNGKAQEFIGGGA